MRAFHHPSRVSASLQPPNASKQKSSRLNGMPIGSKPPRGFHYPCTSGCASLSFRKKRDWIDHEETVHQVEWKCQFPGCRFKRSRHRDYSLHVQRMDHWHKNDKVDIELVNPENADTYIFTASRNHELRQTTRKRKERDSPKDPSAKRLDRNSSENTLRDPWALPDSPTSLTQTPPTRRPSCLQSKAARAPCPYSPLHNKEAEFQPNSAPLVEEDVPEKPLRFPEDGSPTDLGSPAASIMHSDAFPSPLLENSHATDSRLAPANPATSIPSNSSQSEASRLPSIGPLIFWEPQLPNTATAKSLLRTPLPPTMIQLRLQDSQVATRFADEQHAVGFGQNGFDLLPRDRNSHESALSADPFCPPTPNPSSLPTSLVSRPPTPAADEPASYIKHEEQPIKQEEEIVTIVIEDTPPPEEQSKPESRDDIFEVVQFQSNRLNHSDTPAMSNAGSSTDTGIASPATPSTYFLSLPDSTLRTGADLRLSPAVDDDIDRLLAEQRQYEEESRTFEAEAAQIALKAELAKTRAREKAKDAVIAKLRAQLGGRDI